MTYTWNIIGASGTQFWWRHHHPDLLHQLGRGYRGTRCATWKQLQTPILMICLVMSVANVMNYAGMITSIALAVAAVGAIFPLLSPVIRLDWRVRDRLVVNNNILFAGLQATTAQQIGVSQTLRLHLTPPVV